MKPGIKTIIAGVLLCVGAFILPLLAALPIIFGKSDAVQFKVPGTADVTVKDAGRYYLWNDYRTVYEGRSYDQSENIPGGMEIHVRDANGAELRFSSSDSISVSGGSSSKKSIGYVEVEHPGKLKIVVSGGNEDRVFSFGKSGVLKMAGMIAGGIALGILATLAGVALIIFGIIKLVRSNRH